jgi:TPR repeat protein
MSAEIIDFLTRHRAPLADDGPRKPVRTLTTTAKNWRLRSARCEAWRKADAARDFWHAYLKFTDQVSHARRAGVKEAHQHPEPTPEARWEILERYREALGKHLLTPAPDVASVNWKRQYLSKNYIGVTKELLEKAIADDIAFLDAHPTKRRKGVTP